MKSVFLIKTPLQLLNAVEAKYYFNLDSNDCVLIIMGDRKSQSQILSLANSMDEWGSVIILNNVNLVLGNPLDQSALSSFKSENKSKLFSKSFFYVRRLNRISKYLGNAKYIFIGYARYIYMRHFINITPHEKAFLLDDGHATIQLAKERREDFVPIYDVSIKKKLKLLAKRFFQGIKDKEQDSLCFFTIYDVYPGRNDQVIRNDFTHIRSRLSSLEVTEDIYFLGSPIAEAGILTQDNYLKHLKRVNEYFKDKRLIYIAHRRENPEILKEIASELDVEVMLFDYPIEYQLAMIGPRPKVLASFISSALDSCRLIFGDKLKIISFKFNLEDNMAREKIDSIYESYESIEDENFFVESEY